MSARLTEELAAVPIAVVRAACCCALLIAAGCGGGGPAPASAPSLPVCVDATARAAAYADTSAVAGKAAGAVIAGCAGPLANLRWTQVSGPPVVLVSDRTQAISFDVPAAATYAFRVDFTDSAGSIGSTLVNVIAAPAAGGAVVTARTDQAVRMGGNVSLRAWPSAGEGEQTTWEQLDGPAVMLDASEPDRVIFTAPAVEVDTALRFRVTRRSPTGGSDSDEVLVLVERHAQAPASNRDYVFSGAHVSRVYPYRAAGPHADVLVRCVFDANLQSGGPRKNLCPLARLPLLHQQTGGALPTVDQIMQRVLVSHDWMGEVFERFLTVNDASGDIRRLLNGVTAIVIGAHVRPSFYGPATAAIYLDAENFWLTPEQRDVIDESPDFRIDFSRDLSYGTLWRYVVDNASIFLPYPASSRRARDPGTLAYEAGWLLFHELAHASDFIPPATRGVLNEGVSAWDNAAPRFAAGQLPSDVLRSSFPLASVPMFELGRVKFWGASASTAQRALLPADVTAFFAGDRATDDYAYSVGALGTTPREDPALLFEEFMVARNLGARRDFAITDKLVATSTSASVLVSWGQRGRIGDPAIKPRAQQIVAAFAPWIAASEVAALPLPLPMRPGQSWSDNLVLPSAASVASMQARRVMPDPRADAYLLRKASHRPGMSPPGRPKGEFPSVQREGGPMSPPGHPKGEFPSAQREGSTASRRSGLR